MKLSKQKKKIDKGEKKKEGRRKKKKKSSLSNDGGSEGHSKATKAVISLAHSPPSRMRVNDTVSVPSAALK